MPVPPPRAQTAWHGHHHGHGATATLLCAPQSPGKVWGRSIRTRFLKDAIHGAAQRGRCWAEDLGDALGKESTCAAWLLVLLQPFVTSARGEDELGQLQLAQLGEGRGTALSPSPPGLQHHGPCTRGSRTQVPSAVSPRVHPGWSTCPTEQWLGWDPSRGGTGAGWPPAHCALWHCCCGQLGLCQDTSWQCSGTAGRAVPSPPRRARPGQCPPVLVTQGQPSSALLQPQGAGETLSAAPA